jgi:hypothetical protein
MSEENFEEVFSQIIKSEDLKDLSESLEREKDLTIKELLLVQQSLGDSISRITDVIYITMGDNSTDVDDELEFGSDSPLHNLISTLYKISEDFNEYMAETYEDNVEFIFEFEEMDEEEDDEDDN